LLLLCLLPSIFFFATQKTDVMCKLKTSFLIPLPQMDLTAFVYVQS
jgi:hypothetical protein